MAAYAIIELATIPRRGGVYMTTIQFQIKLVSGRVVLFDYPACVDYWDAARAYCKEKNKDIKAVRGVRPVPGSVPNIHKGL